MEAAALMMGIPHGDRLYAVLRYSYYWRNMRGDCLTYVAQMKGKQIEVAKYRSPPYLFPTHKGNAPFTTWAIDCITGLKPVDPDGGSVIVMAIDAFTKWIEYRVLSTLDSF